MFARYEILLTKKLTNDGALVTITPGLGIMFNINKARLNKIAGIVQTTFSSAFLLIKALFVFRFQFQLNLFPWS